MTNLSKKVLAAFSAGTMLFSVVTPVFATEGAETTLQISGNGSQSTNTVTLLQQTTTSVTQSNDAKIFNDVDASANSGGNDANGNTGGDVLVATGDAKTDVAVSTEANSNVAEVNCCGATDASVLISGNGTGSTNDANLNLYNTTDLDQYNKAKVINDVDAKANSGYNDANANTGGDVIVSTGKATTLVDVANAANANWAQVGGGQGGSGQISAMILGNGSGSDNDVDLVLINGVALDQSNYAYIYNDIDAKANSGKNDANANTGGDVIIDTGDAKTDVEVDNMVNFNAADVDCGCLLDVLAKVAGNGENSKNDISATLASTLDVAQDNCKKEYQLELFSFEFPWYHKCAVDNDVYAKSDSGKNDAEANTGSPEGGDPAILTGAADTFVDVSNSGNSNAYGVESEFEWPSFDFNFNLSLSWSDLLALLGH